MHISKLKFYLKSCSTVYFFKDILKKALLFFAFTVFLVDSLHIKRFHYVKCFSQFVAKCTRNKLPQSQNENNFFNSEFLTTFTRKLHHRCSVG